VAAGAKEQELVLFYAVAVFLSFLVGLLAMARFARREGRRIVLAMSLLGAVVVSFTLAFNLSRGDPIALARSLAGDRRGALEALGAGRQAAGHRRGGGGGGALSEGLASTAAKRDVPGRAE
jgi:hypothetical protein